MSEDRRVPVISPISGIFYRRPAPDQAPFVEVGTAVKKGQTLCLLETMKVFTKIKAPADGQVVEVLVESESAVGKNQVLFYISA